MSRRTFGSAERLVETESGHCQNSVDGWQSTLSRPSVRRLGARKRALKGVSLSGKLRTPK